MTGRRAQRHATLLLVLIATGCTSAAPVPTGSPSLAATVSPTLSPSPSPSPSIDVVREFVRKATDPSFAARGTFSGRITIGAASGTFTGEFTSDGPDYRSSFVLRSGSRTLQTREEIETGGKKYVRQGQGPWVLEAALTGGAAGARKGVSGLLATVRAVRHLGVEPHAGRQLHRLRTPGLVSLDPAALRLGGSSARNATGLLDFLAEPNGDLAVMILAGGWREIHGDGRVDRVKATATYTFTDVTGPFSISAPSDVWQRLTSERFGYSMAYPEGWKVESDKDGDYYLSPSVEEVHVLHHRAKNRATDLTDFSAEAVAAYLEQFKVRPETNQRFTLGGNPARLLTYHAIIDREKTYFQSALAVNGTSGYEVVWYSPPANEQADRALFMQFLSTFKYMR